MRYLNFYSSPLGKIILASDGKDLTGLSFSAQSPFGTANEKGGGDADLPVFEESKHWLDAYFKGNNPGKIPPISFEGATPFQKRVWGILLTIPYGETMTYGEIAKEIEIETGKRASSQAVGAAVGRNPLSIVVPCHRGMGANGDLTGYAGGMKRKIALLRIEGNDASSFRLPKTRKDEKRRSRNENL